MEVGTYLSASQKKRKQRRRYFFIALSVIVACLIFLFAFWLVFKSPVFKVKNIVVYGNSSVSSDDVISLVRSVTLEKHNIKESLFGIGNMLSWPNSISSSDVSAIPELTGIKIEKDYISHTIAITVTERKPFAVWCFMPKTDISDENNNNETSTVMTAQEADEECYWFDTDGIMFENGFDSEGSLIIAIHDYSQTPAPLGAAILPARFIPNLISIFNVLRASGLNVREVRLNDISMEEIQATTYDGPDILFSLRFSADVDLQVIKSVMAKPGFNKLQYLDFRTEDRAYYK